jgi:hypothetical protein
MALSGSLKASLNFTQTAAPGLGSASNVVTESITISFTDGTGANQLNVLWSDIRTLTATSETLDINGILTSAYGATVSLLRVKGIYVRNTSTTNGNNLLVGGAASNAWATLFGDVTDKFQVLPSGVLLAGGPLATGYAVTAGTADQLKVDSGSATITYRIALLGCNA